MKWALVFLVLLNADGTVNEPADVSAEVPFLYSTERACLTDGLALAAMAAKDGFDSRIRCIPLK